MRVYRIARKEFIQDITGTGSRLYGGRWNSRGTALLYTAPSRALAMAEVAVHLHMGMLSADFHLAELEAPDEASRFRIEPEALPEGWKAFPPPLFTARIGDAFVREGKDLILEVPSAVVQGDFNLLINPVHPLAAQVRVAGALPFAFDARIVRP